MGQFGQLVRLVAGSPMCCSVIYFKGFYSKNNCIPLKISIIQKVEQLGFHRDINWLIEAADLKSEKWSNATCELALKLQTGPAVFVNPYQIEDLARLGKIDALVLGEIDLEAVAHEAKSQDVYIFLDKIFLLHKIYVKLPINLRYHRSLNGEHAKVKLQKPDLLVYCSEKSKNICSRNIKISPPNHLENLRIIRPWRKVSYEADFSEVELLVPVGNLDEYGFVAIITCIIGCAGCIYLIALSKY